MSVVWITDIESDVAKSAETEDIVCVIVVEAPVGKVTVTTPVKNKLIHNAVSKQNMT